MENQRALSVDEAAAFTGLTKGYIRKLCHQKKIPYFKPTQGRIFFKQADLEFFIYRGRVAANYELEEKAKGLLNGSGA